jgi:glycosyltransferase involved in cell wall biosynthesis
MKILAVANWDETETPTPWATQRIDALRAAGAIVEVLAVDCLRDRRGFLRLWRVLDERLQSDDFDVVAPLYGSLLGLLCTAQRRVPCALSFAGSDLNGSGGSLLSVFSIGASQAASLLAHGVSVRNRKMREALWSRRARNGAWVIPSGVDVERFTPRSREKCRRRLGLPLPGRRVAFVAQEAARRPGKRIELARAAVRHLPGVTLDVLERVPFADMPDAYAARDALLFTSAVEGSPNCVKEALACGVPVISVDVGDVAQVISGLTNCAIVAPDPMALANAIGAALADGRGCPEGPARMRSQHSLSAMAAQFLSFYEEVSRE